MIAKRIPTILPKMFEEEALEVMRIYSVANQLKAPSKLLTERPFRAPTSQCFHKRINWWRQLCQPR